MGLYKDNFSINFSCNFLKYKLFSSLNLSKIYFYCLEMSLIWIEYIRKSFILEHYFVSPGGELVDAFHNGGQAEVEKLIKEQFSVFLYSEGKGQIINRSEYLRWKYRNQAQVKLQIGTPNFLCLAVF